jgi:16S rRNA (uracil1498-N3)-methyltransferase
MSLKEAIEYLSEIKNNPIKMIAFHTDADILSKSDIDDSSPMAIFIGPEGGWSIDEVDLFHKSEIPVVCLGRQVLRTETAVIAALSKVVFSE